MAASIFWYDFETTGISPSRDRALQVAGIRTNEALEEIGEPLNIYCRLSDDILPHPMASLVTGITVEQMQQGLSEAEFIKRLEQELSQPQTCTAGFNSIRFDDELTRFTLFRNFYDPYAREWQGGNSRWDILDVLRCAWALRPEGIHWPKNAEGQTSFRLEELTRANGIEHGSAHDALADVRATIAMARLLREKQPKLYTYLYNLRKKQAVLQNIKLGQPLVHVSGKFSTQRHCLAVVLPLMQHPTNANAFVVCDLQSDIEPLLGLSAQQIKERLYTRYSDLAEGESHIPLKLIHVNRCPVVLPLNVLRPQDCERLGVSRQEWSARSERLMLASELVCAKLSEVYAQGDFVGSSDPEQQLYQGFLRPRDKSLVQSVREASRDVLASHPWPFDDERLPELLFRYRARNHAETLSEQEKRAWSEFCRARLSDEAYGAPLTLSGYLEAFEQLSEEQRNSELMRGWRNYVETIRQRYQI